MIVYRRICFIALLGLLVTTSLSAHDRFILPSHTVLSGDAQKITLLASISNDIFHPDKAFGDNGKGVVKPSLQGLFNSLQANVTHPDGTTTDDRIWQAFARYSVADLDLADSGTYRVSLTQPVSRLITFKKADGSHGRAFGPNAEVPEGATEVVRRATTSNVTVFITRNQPTREALKPSGLGLELGGESHPNDLFAKEPASFQLFHNGKPLTQSVDITLVRGGTRHRNQREVMEIKTDAEGKFSVTFDKAGFYLLQTGISSPGEEGSGIDSNHAGLFVTLEVFPE